MKRILVIGSGSWGTALGQVLNENGNQVLLYCRSSEQKDEINFKHCNSKYFKDVILSENIKATYSFEECFDFIPDIVVLSVPTSAITGILSSIEQYIKPNMILINTAKGYVNEGQGIYELLKSYFPRNEVFSLLGPSHAEEVIVRKLTYLNLIGNNDKKLEEVSKLFINSYFKVEIMKDIEGAEFATSFKNALAIMSGIFKGLEFGDNARAALCTKGINEMLLMSKKLGYNETTLLSYCGIGDVIVTCYSDNSRNFRAGKKIAELNSFAKFEEINKETVEGIRSTYYIFKKAEELKIKLPIIETLYKIMYKYSEPSMEIKSLLERKN